MPEGFAKGSVVDCLLRVYPSKLPNKPMLPLGALRDSTSESAEVRHDLINYMFKEDNSDRFKMSLDPKGMLEEFDRWGIASALTLVEDVEAESTLEFLSAFPGRYYAIVRPNPHDGMKAVRRLEKLVSDYPIVKAISLSPLSIYPFIAPNSKEYYPIYTKAIDLGLPIYVNVGIPGPRVPGAMQNPMHLDEVCWFFPELTVIMIHGGEPWAELCAKLLLKWPNLYYATSAFAPRYYPKAIIDFANKRDDSKVMYAGYWPTLSFETLFGELAGVPFRDNVWPKFLGENARRVLKIA